MFNQFESCDERERDAKTKERLELLKAAREDGFFDEAGSEPMPEIVANGVRDEPLCDIPGYGASMGEKLHALLTNKHGEVARCENDCFECLFDEWFELTADFPRCGVCSGIGCTRCDGISDCPMCSGNATGCEPCNGTGIALPPELADIAAWIESKEAKE